MNLSEIKKEWEKDSVADIKALDVEALSITELHSKYYNVLATEKKKLKLAEINFNKMKKIKRDYFSGRLSRKQIAALGWNPIEHELKEADIRDNLKGDEDLCEIEKEMALSEIKIDFLKDIIEAVHKRGYNIRVALDFQVFIHGGK